MSAGILAHLLGRLPYKQLATRVAEYDFPYVQLALSKAISDVDCSLGKLSPGLANEIGGAFADRNVGIAVLGCYVNIIDLDEETFRHNVDRFKEHLRHARYFGAPTVALEVGVPPQEGQDELHWKQLFRALDELVEEAEKYGATIALEAAQRHLIHSVDTMARALERYPSSCLGVLIDPCNMLNPSNFDQHEQIITEAFRTYGSRIVSAHAKDLVRTSDGRLIETAAGLGNLNYSLFFELLEQYKPLGYVTLEAVKEDQMLYTRSFVKQGRLKARASITVE